MSKKFKGIKLLSVLLSALLLASSFPFAFAEEEEAKMLPLDEKYTEALGLLTTLGVYTANEAEEISADKEITRGEFTKRLIKTMNMENTAKNVANKTVFMDVFDSEQKGYINLAYDMGITKGTGSAEFAPNEPAPLQTAVCMVMRALGYNYYKTLGDFYTKAKHLGVLKEVGTSKNLSEADAALLLYNALHTAALNVSAVNGEIKETKQNIDWLEMYYEIYYVEGIITATEVTGIGQRNATVKGHFMVGDTEIFNAPQGTVSRLGYPVRCYYEFNDAFNIYKYMTSYGFKLREIELTANKVANLISSMATFYDENDVKETEQISSSADFVYNGKAESLGKHGITQMKNGLTKLKLLDNNNDDIIDVVFIEKSTTFAVESVDTAKKEIMGKNSEYVKLQKNSNDLFSLTFKDGTDATVNDIKQWSVVTVTTNFDGDYVTAVISNDTVTGTAEAYREGTPCYVTIDGEEYEISKTLIDKKELQTGKTGTFCFGADGVIYAINMSADGAGKWVWAVNLEPDEAFGDTFKFGCVEGSGADFKVYEVASKVTVDGDLIKEEKLSSKLGASAFPEAMMIWVNENSEITKINSLALGKKESTDENIYKRHTGPESATVLNDGKLWFNGNGNSFQGKYLVANDSVNYAFPTYDKTAYEDMFLVTYKHDEPPYSVTLYSKGQDGPMIDFSISLNLSKGGSTAGSTTGAIPFIRTGKGYDEETGDIYDMLYYMNVGNVEVGVKIPDDIKTTEMVYSSKSFDFDGDGTNDYTGSEKKPISWIIDRLEEGDLIRITTDQNGLAGVQHVYDVSKRELVQGQGSYCWTTETAGGANEIRLFAGRLYDIKDTYLRIITNEASYTPVTGDGMEVHTIKAKRAEAWTRVLTINKNGHVTYSSVTGTPAYAGVKQGCGDIELVMQSMYGDALFKIFIDYSNSSY